MKLVLALALMFTAVSAQALTDAERKAWEQEYKTDVCGFEKQFLKDAFDRATTEAGTRMLKTCEENRVVYEAARDGKCNTLPVGSCRTGYENTATIRINVYVKK
jgi:hypothetical protein